MWMISLLVLLHLKNDANEIHNKLKIFLADQLKFEFKNLKIRHARNDMTHFLDTDIIIKQLEQCTIRKNFSNGLIRKSDNQLLLLCPINKVVDKLVARGIAKPGGVPTC